MSEYICGCNIVAKAHYQSSGVTRRDHDGFQVCPEHGERIKGWKTNANRNRRNITLVLDNSSPDLRDMRDPQEVGEAFLLKRQAKANGHSKHVIEIDDTTQV